MSTEKIVASYIVHYGAEWLYWSLRSVVDWVEEVHIFYTRTPSHGYPTNQICPESREMLYTACIPFWEKGYKIGFHDVGPFQHEGYHRDYAVDQCFNTFRADTIIVVDADELWPDASIWTNVIPYIFEYKAKIYRIGMRHFWRSLNWVCDDEAMPIRIIRKNYDLPEMYIPAECGKVYHMGYAQTPKIVAYKQDIHGHKAEWRSGWFQNTFLPWKPGMGDVHPTNLNYWYPKPYNFKEDHGVLAYNCNDHPFWGVDIIE